MSFYLEQKHKAVEFELLNEDFEMLFDPAFVGWLSISNGGQSAHVKMSLEELQTLVVGLREMFDKATEMNRSWKWLPEQDRENLADMFNSDRWMMPDEVPDSAPEPDSDTEQDSTESPDKREGAQ